MALVTPWAVVLAWLAGAGALRPPAGATHLSPAADLLGRAVTDQTQVVVLGNSQALAAVQPDALSEALGLDEGVASLSVESTRLPIQLALLQQLVYARDLSPKVVVVPMAWTQLVDPSPPAARVAARYRSELAAVAPIIARKVHGRAASDSTWARARAVWLGRRDAALDWVTRLPATLVTDDPASRIADARRAAIGDERMGLAGMDIRMIPVVEAAPASRAIDPPSDPIDAVEASLLPELAELVHAHGGRLVVASLPQQRADLRASAADERAWIRWLAAHEIAYADLGELEVDPAGWRNDGHLGPEAGQIYTEALAELLRSLHALGDAPLVLPSPGYAPDSVARIGALPALPVISWSADASGCTLTGQLPAELDGLADDRLEGRGLGLGSPLEVHANGTPLEGHALPKWATPCDGSWAQVGTRLLVRPLVADPSATSLTVRWSDEVPLPVRVKPSDRARSGDLYLVAPDGGLRWTAPPPPAGATVQVVAIELFPALDDPEGAVSATLSGVTIPLQRDGVAWLGELPFPATEPATVEIRSSADGPWLAVRGLFVHHGQTTERWVGSPDALGDTLVLAGLKDTSHRAASPPPPVQAQVTLDGTTAHVALGLHEQRLTDAALVALSGNPQLARCNPLRLVAVDKPLPAIRLSTWTPTHPQIGLPKANATSARRVVLGSGRGCEQAVWVYPGDVLTLQSDNPRALARPARWLTLDTLVVPQAGKGTLTLELLDADGVAVHASLDVDEGTRRLVVPLDRPVGAVPPMVRLEVSASADVYVLVRHAALHAEDPSSEVLDAR